MCVSDCIRISEKHGTHVFGYAVARRL